jgi:hypothetical protein
VIEETPVSSCRRRGPVIDLVLDRPRLARSQFVFTESRGRSAIFWQTQKAAKAANPGARIPRARSIPEGFTILVDTRERYPYRFAGRGVEAERVALGAGDYAVGSAEAFIATVERKTLENLASSLSDGTLAFQMQRLSEAASAALVVEGRYPALFKIEHVSGAPPGSSPTKRGSGSRGRPPGRCSTSTRRAIGSSIPPSPWGTGRELLNRTAPPSGWRTPSTPR